MCLACTCALNLAADPVGPNGLIGGTGSIPGPVVRAVPPAGFAMAFDSRLTTLSSNCVARTAAEADLSAASGFTLGFWLRVPPEPSPRSSMLFAGLYDSAFEDKMFDSQDAGSDPLFGLVRRTSTPPQSLWNTVEFRLRGILSNTTYGRLSLHNDCRDELRLIEASLARGDSVNGDWQSDLYIPDDPSSLFPSGVDLCTNAWQHYVVTWDFATGLFAIYIDGIKVLSLPGMTPTAAIRQNFAKTRFMAGLLTGCRDADTGCFDVTANQDLLVDEMFLLTRAAMAAEVQQILASGLSGSESGLVGWWRFDSLPVEPSLARDSSGRGWDLTAPFRISSGKGWSTSRAPISRNTTTFGFLAAAGKTAPMYMRLCASPGASLLLGSLSAKGSIRDLAPGAAADALGSGAALRPYSAASVPPVFDANFSCVLAPSTACPSGLAELGAALSYAASAAYSGTDFFLLNATDGSSWTVRTAPYSSPKLPRNGARPRLTVFSGQRHSPIFAFEGGDCDTRRYTILDTPARGLYYLTRDSYQLFEKPWTAIDLSAAGPYLGRPIVGPAIIFKPNPETYGWDYASLHWKATDAIEADGVSNYVDFTVKKVINPPLLADTAVATAEDVPRTIKLDAVSKDGLIMFALVDTYPTLGELYTLDTAQGAGTKVTKAAKVDEGYVYQWASRVLSFSTQWSRTDYAADQVLGPPSTNMQFMDTALSWTPATENPPLLPGKRYSDWLEVEFNASVYAVNVEIHENNKAGTIVAVALRKPDGAWDYVWQGERIPLYPDEYHIFRPDICVTSYKTNAMRIEMDMRSLGWSEIDAIMLIGIGTLGEGILASSGADNSIQFQYRPLPDVSGPDLFSFIVYQCSHYLAYRISPTPRLAVNVTVVAVNDAPRAPSVVVKCSPAIASASGPGLCQVLLPVTDVDSPEVAVRVSIVALPASSTLYEDALGTRPIVSAPAALATGARSVYLRLSSALAASADLVLDEFLYSASDGLAVSPVANVLIQSHCPNGYIQPNGQAICSPCPAGTTSNLKLSSPTAAAASAIVDRCDDCGPGTYAPHEGSPSCTPCPVGTFSEGYGNRACTPCLAGQHQDRTGQTECLWCDIHSYSPEEGAAVCSPCPANAVTSKLGAKNISDCACDRDYVSFGELSRGSKCFECKSDRAVCSGTSIAVKPDYWLDVGMRTSLEVYPCKVDGVCLGQQFDFALAIASNDTGLSSSSRVVMSNGTASAMAVATTEFGQCSPGYSGIMCLVCERGYVQWAGNLCRSCAGRNRGALIFLGVLVWIFLCATAVALAVRSAHKPSSELVALLKIGNNFVTILLFCRGFTLSWPVAIVTAFSFFSVTASPLEAVVPLDCYIADSILESIPSIYMVTIAYLLLPLLCIAAPLAHYALVHRLVLRVLDLWPLGNKPAKLIERPAEGPVERPATAGDPSIEAGAAPPPPAGSFAGLLASAAGEPGPPSARPPAPPRAPPEVDPRPGARVEYEPGQKPRQQAAPSSRSSSSDGWVEAGPSSAPRVVCIELHHRAAEAGEMIAVGSRPSTAAEGPAQRRPSTAAEGPAQRRPSTAAEGPAQRRPSTAAEGPAQRRPSTAAEGPAQRRPSTAAEGPGPAPPSPHPQRPELEKGPAGPDDSFRDRVIQGAASPPRRMSVPAESQAPLRRSRSVVAAAAEVLAIIAPNSADGPPRPPSPYSQLRARGELEASTGAALPPDSFRDRVIQGAIVLLFLSYSLTVEKITRIYKCTSVAGKVLLDGSMGVACYTPGHVRMMVACCIPAAFFVFGLPLSAVFLLFKNRRRLAEPVMETRFAFLYLGYHERACWYEGVILMRKSAIVLLHVFLGSRPIAQLLLGVLVLVISLQFSTYVRPFRGKHLNVLEAASLFTCLVTIALGALTQESDSASAGALIVAVNAAFLTALGYFVLQSIRHRVDLLSGVAALARRLRISSLASLGRGRTYTAAAPIHPDPEYAYDVPEPESPTGVARSEARPYPRPHAA